MKIIAGLGNPGKKYQRTRHNIGFMLVDMLAERWQCPEFREAHYAQIVSIHIYNDKVFLVKPQTYMNESGRAIHAIKDYYSVPAEHILIVLDDVELPLGSIRIRPSGSSGGHKGLQSVIEHCATTQIPRLRIGVGKPNDDRDLAEYVLEPFLAEELPIVNQVLQTAKSAVECWLTEGIQSAMNKFNRKENKANHREETTHE